MANWTQPLCIPCWNKENPGQQQDPWMTIEAENLEELEAVLREAEHCCMCGKLTIAGIYIRRNPMAVPYPKTMDIE